MISEDDNDRYNISRYTDAELYNILDITNPTDRELEARILSLVRKYTNIQNEDGKKLRKFFENIYDHFFENDNEDEDEYEEDNEEKKEGFSNMNVDYAKIAKETTPTPSKDDDKKSDSKKTTSQLVTTADYVPDSLRLNPLLKQTIKRIICIDSQYRDVTVYPNTNNFSFDLSEPLRDVVSLKLYSIQIPYTWYTISKSYGSNFFYLKGNADGINNGNHDYKVEIPPGNYDSGTIIKAINEGFIKVFEKYPDTSFNNTKINYDTRNSLTTIDVDIQKVYTESYYTTNFTTFTPSTTIINQNGDTVAISDVSRNTSIPCYLGFNYQNYSPNCIYSRRNHRKTLDLNDNLSNKQFYFDNSNNYFTVIQYIGPELYVPNKSNVVNTYTITLYDTVNNTGNPVVSNVNNPPYIYSRQEVINMVNTAIQNANIFTSDSKISQKDISGNVIDANYSNFELKLMFDRNKVLYQPNGNMLVIFPEEIRKTEYDNKTIWSIYQAGSIYSSGISCFYFTNLINDFSIINAELPIVQSNFNTDNAYIKYKCITPSYMINSVNDFSFNIQQGDYTLDQYITVLNNFYTPDSSGNYKIPDYKFYSDTKFSINDNFNIECIMNFERSFKENNYMIYFDETSVLCKILKMKPTHTLVGSDASGNYPLHLGNVFDCSFAISYVGYILDSSYILTILPLPGTPNENEPPRNIYLPGTSYANYTYLLNSIQTTITGYTIINTDISDVQFPYSSTTIIPKLNNNIINVTFTQFINYKLFEHNYIMSFYPANNNVKNPWRVFGLQQSCNDFSGNVYYNSYNLYEKQIISTTLSAYSKITGTKQVNQNQINITSAINTFTINANYDSLGGAYTPNGVNDITITIPVGKYTTNSLCLALNNELNNNKYTYGSRFYTEIDNFSNLFYVKFILNYNKIYTSEDYNLVFFDPFSFASCNSNQGIQKTTWDNTLGWILGYRDFTTYVLQPSNQTVVQEQENTYYHYLSSTNGSFTFDEIFNDSSKLIMTNSIITLTSDTTLTTNLYNYFVISLDDYNQNHINDGLVTITRQQTSIQLPSLTSNKICDPVTNTMVSRSVVQTNSDNLNANQIYAINQSNASQNTATKVYSAGPYIKDLFGYVPIKPGQNGTFFIEYGGSLQSQERLYFGPVNIRKMSIQLLNDRGDLLELNGSNWSFSFICEQLYRSGNSSANK